MWFVKFKDNSGILGRLPDGTEVPFGRVLPRLSEVAIIGYTINQKTILVDLSTGVITINGTATFRPMRQEEFAKLKDVRPIYFVRERVDFAHNFSATGAVLFTAIGFQGNTEDGRSVKRILEIDDTGHFDIVDN